MPPDVDRLLANAGWVKSLAVRLVADEAAADDLAQETWLRALERPPRAADTPRSLRAWLARVVGRFARQQRRHDAAAERRERAVASAEAQPDVADVVAHAELHRRVVDAVLELDEPYRATLLLRFFEDETPARIAARMGVPVKTVYTRLERALARMRDRFDAERRPGGELHSWVAGAPLLAGPVLAGRLPTEIVVMSGRAWIAVGVLVAAGAVVLRWTTAGDGRLDGARPVAATSATEASGSKGVEPASATADAKRRAEAPSVAAPRSLDEINEIVFSGSIAVTGRVVDESSTPIRGARLECTLPDAATRIEGVEHEVDAEIRAHGFWDAPCAPPRKIATSAADGAFAIDGLRSGLPYTLAVSAAGFRSTTLTVPFGFLWGSTLGNAREVRLPEVVLVRGRDRSIHVVDEHGVDAAGASVFTGPWPLDFPFLWLHGRRLRGRTDARGNLTILGEESERCWIVARAEDGRFAVATDVARSTPADKDSAPPPLELRLDPGEALTVHVRDGDATPLAGVRVSVRCSARLEGVQLEVDACTSDDGNVRFRGLSPGPKTVYASAPGGMPTLSTDSESPRVLAAGEGDVVVTLRTARPPIAVRFVDAVDRAPVRATRLLVVDGDVDGPPSGRAVGGRDVPTRGIGAVGADGTTGTLLLSPARSRPAGDDRFPRERQSERFRVIVDARDHARAWLGPFDPDQLPAGAPLVLELPRGRIVEGTVVDGSGAPIPFARVHEAGPGAGRASNMFTWQVASVVQAARADAKGRFAIGPLADGKHAFVVDAVGFRAKEVDVTLAAADPSDLRFELEPGSSISGTVDLEPDDEPGAFLVLLDRRSPREPDDGPRACGIDAEGRFEFSSLAPGDYTVLAIRPPARESEPFRFAWPLLAGDGTTPVARQAARVHVAGAVESLRLEPWREDATRRVLDTTVVDAARPGVNRALVLYLDANRLRHREEVAIANGRLRVELAESKEYFVLLTEAARSDGGTAAYPCNVASYVLTADDLRRGVPPLQVKRGHLTVRVTNAPGAALDGSMRLRATTMLQHTYGETFPDLLTLQPRAFALGSTGTVAIPDLPVGRTWLYVGDDSGHSRGDAYVDVVAGRNTEVDLVWK